MTAEQAYGADATATHRKEFGQYFTPTRVAHLMADWIGQINPSNVLDPSVGTGVLSRAIYERCSDVTITGYEKDANILRYISVPDDVRVRIRQADFLDIPISERYDGVIMNPPYVRHREMEGYESHRHVLSIKAGFQIPRSANLYIYFAIKAAMHLDRGGRASILIPTEWMNANFAVGFKQYLLNTELLKEIVLFSGCSTIFEDALTTASILLLEKSN